MLTAKEIEKILSKANMPKLENILTPQLITRVNTIYKITNIVNGKCYIGQTSKMTIERWQRHIEDLRKGKHHSHSLQNAYNKYGEKNFTFKVIDVTTAELLNEKEIDWIDRFDSYYNGYNETLGGDGFGSEVNSKPVYQYDLEGELVKTYRSLLSVSEADYDFYGVGEACHNKYGIGKCIYKNLIWSYVPLTKEQILKIVSEYEEKKKESQKSTNNRISKVLSKKVYKYSTVNGELIKEYKSITSVKEDGYDRSCVSAACNNKYWGTCIYRDYIWSCKSLEKEIILEIVSEYELTLKHPHKYSMKTGELVKIYESVKSVSEDGFNPNTVSDACCNRYLDGTCIYNGYIWSYTTLTKEQVLKIASEYVPANVRRSKSAKKRFSNPNERIRYSELAKKRWSDPNEHSRMSSSMRGKNTKLVYQYTLDLQLVRTYTSSKECREYGFSETIVCDSCRNVYGKKKNVYKGFIWSYIPLTANEEEA